METVVFLPVRKDSQRVKHKNTRAFSDSGLSLLQIKINQLVAVNVISRIVVSTNDELAIEQAREFANDKVVIDIRPESLCAADTEISDLTKYAASVCKSETILWTHVTSPFFSGQDYSAALAEMQANAELGFDSLATVRQINEFVLDQNFVPLQDLRNWTHWPRTQDLDPLFVFTSAMFLAPRAIFESGARLGNRPYFLVCEDLPSTDIDTETDWAVSKALFRAHQLSQR